MAPVLRSGLAYVGLAQAPSRGVERPLLMTVLSVVAGWSLLGTLVLGLFMILKPLESVRGYMQKIAMGVRAIEQQTKPFGERAGDLTSSLGEESAALAAVGERLADVERHLDAAAPALRRRR
jgi:hypothetical protein